MFLYLYNGNKATLKLSKMTQLKDLEKVIIQIPFTGSAQAFITKEGKIAYSVFDSFEDYQKDNPTLNLKVVSWDEYNELHSDFFKRPFTEITEDQWENALGALPPVKWHDISEALNVFFCSEPMSGLFHSCYIYNRSTGKYYAGMKSIISSDEELLNDLRIETAK